jgi:hypothetical protein
MLILIRTERVVKRSAVRRGPVPDDNPNFLLADNPGSQIPGLFDSTRADDEDIHQSSGARLPIGRGRDIGDADQSAE